MIAEKYTKRFAPVLLFFVMLVDSHITNIMIRWTDNRSIATAHLLLLLILILSEILNERFMILVAVALGLICDLYYIGVVGIYATVLPATVALIYFFNDAVHQSILTLFFSMIIFVTFFEFGILLLQTTFNLVSVSSSYFISELLGPTLLLNMILFAIFVYPLHRLFTTTEERLY